MFKSNLRVPLSTLKSTLALRIPLMFKKSTTRRTKFLSEKKTVSLWKFQVNFSGVFIPYKQLYDNKDNDIVIYVELIHF